MSAPRPHTARRGDYIARMKSESTALLIVDVQDSFKYEGRWERRNNRDFEANLDRLVTAWREAELPLFFIIHTDSDPGFGRNDPEFRIMDFLQRRDDEPLVLKNTRNSFTSTDLQSRLDAIGIKRLVITGLTTEQCCETTTRIAADLGYEVDFVTEATATFPIAGFAMEDIVARTEAVLRGRFARIATVDEVVAEIGVPASTT